MPNVGNFILLLKFQKILTKIWKFSPNFQKPENWPKLNGLLFTTNLQIFDE